MGSFDCTRRGTNWGVWIVDGLLMSEARFSSGLVLRVVIGAEGFCG